MTLTQILELNRSEPIKKLSFSDVEDNFKKLPIEILELTQLETLNLGRISIGRNIKIISELSNLKELFIHNFRLKKFPINLLQLKKLRHLHLGGPNLEELPEELDGWKSLTYLYCEDCINLKYVNGIPPKLTYLALDMTLVHEIPTKIYTLKSLRKFVAINLGLSEIPKEIFNMNSLLSLFLSDNKISSISNDIKKLSNLTELVLSNNHFRDFPSSITSLSNLTNLELNQNYISNIPESIRKLKNLEKISLYDNNFEDFPIAILEMNKLKEINLSNIFNRRLHPEQKNNIKNIPPEIIKLHTLKKLTIDHNPIDNVPYEIFVSGYDAIKNFFESKLEADSEEFLFEAKMVIVGRGNVGKTVLTKRLTDPNYNLSKSESTKGIDVLKNPLKTKLYIDGEESEFKLNIWDFGGQEKYDATHQLFITKRSIYLFLTEAREESNYMDFFYWLNTIQLFSGNSPIIIILSKIDERKKSLPESIYKERFDNILEFVDVSCAPGYEGTIDKLKISINNAIKLLPQTKLKLSNRWIEVRNELEYLSQHKDFISYDDYLQICDKHKLDKKRADFLSQYLNDLGAIIHHQHDLLLKETVFINTDWCVDGMYQILDSVEISDNYGKFTQSDLEIIWSEKRFSNKKAELLKLMHQYHLCFELKDNSGFISPDLLPSDKPDNFIWDYTSNLQFEYSYDFMPAGLLGRFIVKSHSFIKDALYWKHGVVLNYENTDALVEEDYIKGKIKISLNGKNKKGLLSAIRMYVEEVHLDFDKAGKLLYKQMVPCNCIDCQKSMTPHFFNFEVLRKFEEKGKINVLCDKSAEDVIIKSLIDDIELNSFLEKIKTNKDLKDFVLNLIDTILERDIRLKGSNINFWRDQNFTTPKNETEVQPYISNTLDHYCKSKGINLSREVKEANGNVDILLSTKNDQDKLLKVCIEIKKAHHNDVTTAIRTQLPKYMESTETDSGIYLVIWQKNENHPYPAKFPTLASLYQGIEKNNNHSGISTKILNCCKVESPSKIKL
ncbi:COR domain-containing protein [Chryseobacterium sp. JV558]|uniref:COR domain-containing protein n=1 Tax=Chryseobacterium sp. JV558 TaxID=2663236 RepID=UPI00299EC55F|nr:COR domain-containing protein [Chryseobacterium sp. JV558]MDW9379959.1 GTP-binding protein [Chryseobacterium sp. JV558]